MTWFDTNYLHKKQITIDHTKVGASDSTSFPVLISRTDIDLKTVGNGGHVQNSNGFDIIFTDSAEATKLDHEIEHYVATTGEFEMWVRIPTLSHTADTVIYCYYDNASISTSQENVNAVWDTNFKGVWHLKESAGTAGSIKDSTSGASHLDPYTNSNTNTLGDISTSAGQIDGAQSFDGSGHAIRHQFSAGYALDIASNVCISAWVKRATSATTGSIVVQTIPGFGGGYCLEIGVSPYSGNQIKLTKYGLTDITLGSMPADTAWHHLYQTGDAGHISIYIDGAFAAIVADNNTYNSGGANPTMYISGGEVFWNGAIDEVRISNAYRSADWITAEYNNQSSPSTFYSVGAEQSQSSTKSLITQAEAKFYVHSNLQTQSRAKFLVRLALKSQAQAKFLVSLKLLSQARSQFFVRSLLQTQAQAKFLIRLKLATNARAKFVSRLALKAITRAKFLINQVINPLKQFKVAFVSQSKDKVAFVSQSIYSITFSEAIAMITPNSTIQSSATVTDANNNPQATLTGTVTVLFPDGTSSAPLTPANAGSGVYTLTYTTKGNGLMRELWSFVDGSGNTLTDENTLVCTYSH